MKRLIQLIVVSWANCIEFLNKVWADVSISVTCISEEAVYLWNIINHLTFSLILLIVKHLLHSPAPLNSWYVPLILNDLLIRREILSSMHSLLFVRIFHTHLAFPLLFNLVTNHIIIKWLQLLFDFLVVMLLGIPWLHLFRVFISEHLMIRS